MDSIFFNFLTSYAPLQTIYNFLCIFSDNISPLFTRNSFIFSRLETNPVTIEVNDDNKIKPNETFNANLSGPSNAPLLLGIGYNN